MRDYLVQLRAQRDESHQDVANALGVSRQYYSMIESGERQKKMDTSIIFGLAAHFGVTAAEILAHEAARTESTQ